MAKRCDATGTAEYSTAACWPNSYDQRHRANTAGKSVGQTIGAPDDGAGATTGRRGASATTDNVGKHRGENNPPAIQDPYRQKNV